MIIVLLKLNFCWGTVSHMNSVTNGSFCVRAYSDHNIFIK